MKLPEPRTIVEPFRIKTVEPLPFIDARQRSAELERVGYNLFELPADVVSFDLLTDSGTSAMSATQWAAMMVGDESYAGAKSFRTFEKAVQDLTGYEFIVPTHQGRSAEALLMKVLVEGGQTVIGNTHFDTTRANIEAAGAVALDLPCPIFEEESETQPFKGNIDPLALEERLKDSRQNVAAIIMTVTNNSVGGQPVSMENLQRVRALSREYGVPLFLDAARFAENAYFIKLREKGWGDHSTKEIAQQMFALADGTLMSAKKDAFGNIGGFLALNCEKLAKKVRTQMVLTEGFPTYGGLAGRDLEALAVGLREILDEAYLAYRIQSVKYFGEGIESSGLKVIKPFGGHGVYIDAGASLPHIPAQQYPGQSLSVALYEHIGIRSVEVGSVMLGHRDPKTGEEHFAPRELVRLAMPRRVYTQSHVDYMIEMLGYLVPQCEELKGYEFVYQADFLRHFTARFRRI